MKYLFAITLIITSLSLAYANSPNQYGPTVKKESLWSITSQYKTPDTTMYQLLLSFFNANPHAFYESNMNRLKQGVYLTIPSTESINNTDFDTAAIIVNQQIKDYEIFYNTFIVIQNEQPLIEEESLKLDKITHASVVEIETEKESVISNVEINVSQQKEQKPTPENKQEITKIKETLAKEVEQAQAKKVAPSTLFNYGQPLKFSVGYDVSVSYDDNLRLAQHDDDIRDDFTINSIFKVDTTIKASRLSRFKLGVFVELDKFSTFSELDSITYGFNSSYVFATNSKFATPIYIIKLSISGLESNSEMRNSNIHKIGLNLNKRLTSNIHFTSGIQFKQRESQSDVFDTNEKSLFVNFDYSLDRKTLIYGTYHFIKGETVSSATPSLDIINASEAIEPDDAFGGIGLNQFAYKLDAETHVGTLGFNYRSSRQLSYDISLRFVASESTENSDIYYDRMILRAGILGRF